MENYFQTIEKEISEMLKKVKSENMRYDLLDTEEDMFDNLITLRVKQRDMKRGYAWQIALGNFPGWKDLKVGDDSGLDIMNEEKQIIIELKNRNNTDNSSSKHRNLEKLAKYKKEHSEWRCIYGNINRDTQEKTNGGFVKDKEINGKTIEIIEGKIILELILGEYCEQVIEFMKTLFKKYNMK